MQLRFVSGRNFPPGRTKDRRDGSLSLSSTTSAVCARHARRSHTGWNEGPRQIRFLPPRKSALSSSLSPRPFVLSRLSYISRSRAVLDIPHSRGTFSRSRAHIIRVTCILFCGNWRLPLSSRMPIRQVLEERRESMALPYDGAYLLLGIVRLSKYQFDSRDALKAIRAKSFN